MRAASGLSLGIAAGALFGTSGSFASSLMDAGWSPAAAVTARVTLAALILTIPAVRVLRGQWHVLRRGAPRIAIFGLVAVGGCQLFYFTAVQHLSVSVALLLEYLGVVLVVGYAWLVHGRRPNGVTSLGALLALAGLALVLDIFGSAHLDVVGLLWGLAAAAGLAVFFVLSDSAEDEDAVPPIVVAWGGMTIGAALLWLLGAARIVRLTPQFGSVTFAEHRVSWLVPVVGLALIAGVLAYTVSIAATRRLGATISSFVGLLEVLFSAGFAWVFVDQRPTALQAGGGLVVLIGIVLVRAGELRRASGSADVPAPDVLLLPMPQESLPA